MEKLGRRNVWIEDTPSWESSEKKLREYYLNTFEWNVLAYRTFDEFVKILERKLPISLRMHLGDQAILKSSRSAVAELENGFREGTISSDIQCEDDGTICHQVSWIKTEHEQNQVEAWQINVTQKILNLPKIKPLYNVIIEKINMGFITRQESVSMLPVLFLDVAPSHSILDLCAAPGSKTTQLLEMLSAQQDDISGFVIANDVCHKRLCVMIHQCTRFSPNARHLIATKHCAMSFPLHVSFDRILCDVPCTCDGTIRKSFDLSSRWRSSSAFHMHRQQISILKRALSYLKVGGRLVYSTCSMNPIENEAVLLHCLTPVDSEYCIVDVASTMPNLKYVPGMTTWRVMDDDLHWYKTFEEVGEEKAGRAHITKSMFPPENFSPGKVKIENSVRILPHFQNTGGFFIAVIEKSRTFDACKEKSHRKLYKPKDNRWMEVSIKNRLLLEKKLGLSSTFPWETLWHRADEGKRVKIYSIVKEAAAFMALYPQLNYQHVGLKLMEIRLDKFEAVTVYQEGADIIRPHLVDEKIIQLEPGELYQILSLSSSQNEDGISICENHSLCTKLCSLRDFFMTSTIMESEKPIHIAFYWNCFLSCWKANISQVMKKTLLQTLDKVKSF